jgi:hypothetical protein
MSHDTTSMNLSITTARNLSNAGSDENLVTTADSNDGNDGYVSGSQ